jgi:hypothetical protein
MKQIIFKKILLLCVFAGYSCISEAQRLAIKTNCLAWAVGYSNFESEWISRHPFSNNIGYLISCESFSPNKAQLWYDRRYWFSGRATIGTALGAGLLYEQKTCIKKSKSKVYQRGAGIQGTLIHCFTLNPRWSLEARIGMACLWTLPHQEVRYSLSQVGISLMYIVH